jgi:hypothetical protein
MKALLRRLANCAGERDRRVHEVDAIGALRVTISALCRCGDRPDDGLAAFMDMDVLDADVLFAAAPQIRNVST